MARSNFNLSQAYDSLKNLSDTVLRNDEKLKSVISEQQSVKDKIKSLEDKSQQLEIKVVAVSTKLGGHDARWEKIIDMLWKCALMITAGYILYALGLQADLAFPPP